MHEHTVTYRIATSTDSEAIRRLLISCLLPPDDLEDAIAGENTLFIVAEAASKVIGSVGLQQYGVDALVRSFAVERYFRGSEVSSKLMQELERHARARDIHSGYLLTTTITNFLLRHGFKHYDRAAVPEAIAQTAQFASVCPDSATCLMRKLA